MSADQALSETLPLIEFAQRTIGGHWEKIDLGAQGCVLPSGKRGAMQAAGRLGPGVPAAEQHALLDKIEDEWTRSGYPPLRTVLPVIEGVEVTRLHYSAPGNSHDDVYLEVMVATTGSTVDSRTRCAIDESTDEDGA